MSEQAVTESDPGWDLVVAGAGGGLAGALRAASLGASVLVVEANARFRQASNTAMSTAMVPGAGTRWQRAAGIDDSPEDFLADIMAKTKGTADRPLAEVLASTSARLVEWLAEDAELPMELATDFVYPGHSRPRLHTVPGRRGAAVLGRLVELAAAHDRVDLATSARLVDVRADADGVSGAVVAYPDGSREEMRTRRVLLATNGFGASSELVAKYIPEIAGATYHGSPESRGDALRIGQSLGAATAYLDAYQGHAALALPHETLVGWVTVMHGAVLVNTSGERFGDESAGYSEFAAKVLAQPDGVAYIILDERIDRLCRAFDDYLASVEAGVFRWADDVAELAALCGLPAGPLRRAVAQAQASATGAPDPLGRTSWEAALVPPFAAVRVGPALFHTQGGLRVDGRARVLRPDGTPIQGLWASGGAAMGISGHGASGYVSGNGLLCALGLALLAGEDAAGEFS